jgi:hypothetical protein
LVYQLSCVVRNFDPKFRLYGWKLHYMWKSWRNDGRSFGIADWNA